jgi:hypothetical protein
LWGRRHEQPRNQGGLSGFPHKKHLNIYVFGVPLSLSWGRVPSSLAVTAEKPLLPSQKKIFVLYLTNLEIIGTIGEAKKLGL